jgi:hypothetical protein
VFFFLKSPASKKARAGIIPKPTKKMGEVAKICISHLNIEK